MNIVVIALVIIGFIIYAIVQGINSISESYNDAVAKGKERKMASEAQKYAKQHFFQKVADKRSGLEKLREELPGKVAAIAARKKKERDGIESLLKDITIKSDLYGLSRIEKKVRSFDVKVLITLWLQHILCGFLESCKASNSLDFINAPFSDLIGSKKFIDWKEGCASYKYNLPKPQQPQLKSLNKLPEPPTIEQIRKQHKELFVNKVRWDSKYCSLTDAELQGVLDNETLENNLKRDELRAENEEIELDNGLAQKIFEHDLKEWEENKKEFEKVKQQQIAAIKKEKELYESRNIDALYDYVKLVLCSAHYPSRFPYEVRQDYTPENKSLVIDYQLPSVEDMPKEKEKRYLKTKQEYKPILFSEAEINKLYDATLYKITLRTLALIFNSDEADAIDMVTFNGWVKYTNKATGHQETSCILSIQCSKTEFLKVRLDSIDPKECFRGLKGIGSSKLHGMAAVAPILEINRADKRFVTPKNVADAVKDGANIAVMPWEDFEHLIRGIFDKEFNQFGGEVKVTRASRDGGVDAVAFDPDPIRGGKIVIQAKRYINTVGVEAVRDLYGTVINEGANKGILITTAEYSPEAYHFAKEKPITLLSGNNLLHLLHKHGHKARIDLKEARELFSKEK